MGIWLFGGFVAQIIVGVVELFDGNQTGGNLFSVFAIFLMMVTGLDLIASFTGLESVTLVSGWAWIVLSIVIIAWMPAYFKAPFTLWLLVLALCVGVPAVCLMDLQVFTGAAVAHVAAYSLLIAGLLGIYNATALILNTTFERTVLPTGTPVYEYIVEQSHKRERVTDQ